MVALNLLTQGAPVPVFPGFNLTLGFDEGASFGMLSGVVAGKPLAMVALTGAITLGLAVMALRARNPWEAAGFALVVGGSLGNIVDRLRQGAVTDFLDFYWRDWHWPAFNMADVAITVGAGLALLAPSRRSREDEAIGAKVRGSFIASARRFIISSVIGGPFGSRLASATRP